MFVKKLVVATLVYILLPTVIFLLSWVKIWISVTCLSLLLFLFWYAVGKISNNTNNTTEPVNWNSSLLWYPLIVAFTISFFSEFGIWNYKSYDYLIHNYKYFLISSGTIPIFDEFYKINLCYYLGFYMVPGMIGKIVGFGHAQLVAFIWNLIGLYLSFIWLWIKFGSKKWSTKKLLLLSALLITGSYVNSILPILGKAFNSEFIINNGINLNGTFVLNQVPIFTRNLSESTQHTLPAILGISFILALPGSKNYIFVIVLFLFATIFWTPFATIGLASFVLLRIIDFRRDLRGILELTIFSALTFVVFSPVVTFLLGSEATNMNSNKFIWNAGVQNWILYYLLYIFAFFGIWLLIFRKWLFCLDKPALLTSIVVLSILGLVQVGYYNDLNIRSSIAPQMVLSLAIGNVVINYYRQLPKMTMIIGLLFLGINSLSPLKFYYERFFILNSDPSANTIEKFEDYQPENNFYDALRRAYIANGEEVVKQYSLKKGSIFDLYCLKK